MSNFAGVIDIVNLNDLLIFHAPVSFVSLIDDHWFCVYATKNHIELFDSLASKSKLLNNSHIVQFLCNNLINRCLKLNRQIQSVESQLCGQFCVVFLKLRSQGLTFDEIVENYDINPNNNDTIVNGLYQLL